MDRKEREIEERKQCRGKEEEIGTARREKIQGRIIKHIKDKYILGTRAFIRA